MEIEGFDEMLSTVTLAKALYDADRFDVVEQHFFDTLSWGTAFESTYATIASIFSEFTGSYCVDSDAEILVFEDEIISNYFTHTWAYGRQHRLSHDQNPHVAPAIDEVCKWLNVSHCVDWKLLAYTKSKRAARRSKLIVSIHPCECYAHDQVAYGLIQIYIWFRDKCAAFAADKEVQRKTHEDVQSMCVKSNIQEVTAA